MPEDIPDALSEICEIGDDTFILIKKEIEPYRPFFKENFTPRIEDFVFEPKEGIGCDMSYDITNKWYIGGTKGREKRVSFADVFYEEQEKTANGKPNPSIRRKHRHGGARIIAEYFEKMFSPFVSVNKESFNVMVHENEEENDDGEKKFYINMVVKFPIQEDTFICSKFKTIFYSSDTSLIKRVEGYTDDCKIPKEYNIHWKRSTSQQKTIAGANNQKTLKAYETSVACDLQFPFYNGLFFQEAESIMRIFVRNNRPRYNLSREEINKRDAEFKKRRDAMRAVNGGTDEFGIAKPKMNPQLIKNAAFWGQVTGLTERVNSQDNRLSQDVRNQRRTSKLVKPNSSGGLKTMGKLFKNRYQPLEEKKGSDEPNSDQPNSDQPNSYQPNSYQPNSYQPNSYQPNSVQNKPSNDEFIICRSRKMIKGAKKGENRNTPSKFRPGGQYRYNGQSGRSSSGDRKSKNSSPGNRQSGTSSSGRRRQQHSNDGESKNSSSGNRKLYNRGGQSGKSSFVKGRQHPGSPTQYFPNGSASPRGNKPNSREREDPDIIENAETTVKTIITAQKEFNEKSSPVKQYEQMQEEEYDPGALDYL